MFTGIIQATGRVAMREERGGDLRFAIDAPELVARVDALRLAVGESVAVSGVCLTVIAGAGGRLEFDVSRETLRLTTLGSLQVGAAVNLEVALRAGDPLGGHLVSGHVDGLARVVATRPDGRSLWIRIAVPQALVRFIAAKGSVALDGVSLTVNAVEGAEFEVNLIPHTVQATTFGGLAPGQALNLEVDTLARYAERLLVHLRP